MLVFPYHLRHPDQPTLGLIVLQPDQTIERDFRRLFPLGTEIYVTRVPSAAEVTREGLATMELHLSGAASLLPPHVTYDVIGYGCTSGTAQIGAAAVAAQIGIGARAANVTEPVSALVAACAELGIKRLAILSPYVAEVSAHLREVLLGHGIETPVFGSFEEAEEARVARIDTASVLRAATDLMAGQKAVDGLFLSCTNLPTLDVIAPLEAELRLPVLSSNLVLGWHMAHLSGLRVATKAPGRLIGERLSQKPGHAWR